MPETDPGGSWISSTRRAQDFVSGVGQHAELRALDAEDQDAGAVGQVLVGDAEKVAQVDNPEDRPAQIDDTDEERRHSRQRRQLGQAHDLLDVARLDGVIFVRQGEGDDLDRLAQFHRRGRHPGQRPGPLFQHGAGPLRPEPLVRRGCQASQAARNSRQSKDAARTSPRGFIHAPRRNGRMMNDVSRMMNET